MENMTTVAPNQLPLFDMLTAEQEVELTRIKASKKRDNNRYETEVLGKVELLTKCGFTSRHFSYSTERAIRTYNFNVARWNEAPVRVDTELDEFRGNCFLLYSRYDKSKNEIVTAKTTFTLRNGKIECCGLTGNWRYYKPETILAKIEESYEIASNQYDLANRTKTNVENTVEKYKKLYPDAEVKAGKGYTSGTYREYSKVTITFKSGSYVELEIGSASDQEYLLTKYDAVFKKMTINEVMDHFNAQ